MRVAACVFFNAKQRDSERESVFVCVLSVSMQIYVNAFERNVSCHRFYINKQIHKHTNSNPRHHTNIWSRMILQYTM